MKMSRHSVRHQELIYPDWPAPASVRAASTTRAGGVSRSPFDTFNLALHVGDDPRDVAANRTHLSDLLDLRSEPLWLEQVHGNTVFERDDSSNRPGSVPQADACVVRGPGAVCVIMTADCLPVLFCDRDGVTVAAAHAGWRGLVDGVLEATMAKMAVAPQNLMAWLGPAIGPQAFEVGDEVREQFCRVDSQAASAFVGGDVRQGKPRWLADLYCLARQRLEAAGVSAVYGGDTCTVTERQRFFSYRRDGQTGRMASLIWLDDR